MPAEFIERQHRIQEAMVRSGVDCLVLLPGGNFRYLTGLSFARERYRLLVAVFGADGRLAIMGPRFEEEKMGSGALETEVHTWTDEEDQYRLVARIVEKRYGARARIGLELTANYYHYLAFRKIWAHDRFADPAPATERVRAIKSNAELQCLKEAAARTRARMGLVSSMLVEDMTELDLAERYGRGAMIQFGVNTSMPNAVAGVRRLRQGDAIVIDAGDRIEGYRSDVTRTFFFGNPSAEMREIHHIVTDAEQAGISAAKPGEPVESIEIAVRGIIEKAGYGEYFTHRSGHGLGLDFHELPVCVRGNTEPLEPGMALTVEPGIYLPGRFGIRMEDDIAITETGSELISEPGPWALDFPETGAE